jgi:hypothetical protein
MAKAASGIVLEVIVAISVATDAEPLGNFAYSLQW